MRNTKTPEFDHWLTLPGDSAPVCSTTDTSLPVLVVGAGPGGLAAMIGFAQAGVAFEGVESHTHVGGIWDETNPLSSVYEGLHMVTSRFTSYLGPPMPDDYEDYVDQGDALRYLRRVADDANVVPHIRFSTRFEGAHKTAAGTWRATLRRVDADESYEREYRAIVIATGSHNRLHSAFPEELREQALAGGVQVVHSADYRSAAHYAGKRVLVIGVGNSGTDIADRVSRAAARTIMAVRTSPWINPQYLGRTPCDKLVADGSAVPEWLGMSFFMLARRLAIGSFRSLGLTRPNYKLNDRVPVSDRGIVGAIREGRVVVRSHVTQFDGQNAVFANEKEASEPVDVVIFATGFNRNYPLFERGATRETLSFYLFDRREPGLVCMTEMVGLRCCWPIFYEQGQAIAAYFAAEQRGSARVDEFNSRRDVPIPPLKGRILKLSDEHSIDYDIYTRLLRGLVRWLNSDAVPDQGNRAKRREMQNEPAA